MAEQARIPRRFSGIAAQFSANERAGGAARTAVDETRHHLLARSRLAGEQHGGFGDSHLLGTAHGRLHDSVAHDDGIVFARCRLQDGRDQIRVRRQRQEFARAVAYRLQRRLAVVLGSAGDDGHHDPLARQSTNETTHIMRHIAENHIGPGVAAQPLEPGADVVGLVHPRATRDCHTRRLAQRSGERSYDQHTHDRQSFRA